MPYYSPNKSKSGVRRGGSGNSGNANALAALAQQLLSSSGGGGQSDAAIMKALGLDPNVPFDIQGIPGMNLLGDTPGTSPRVETRAARAHRIDPGQTLVPKSRSKPVGNQLDSLLQQYLQASQGTGLNQADYEQALNDSANQIKKAFGAEIGAVRAANANARHNTKAGNKQIKAMYRALSNDYHRQAKKEIGSGKQYSRAAQRVANNAQQQLQGTVDKELNQQAALAKNLGVEAAMPSVAAPQRNQLTRNAAVFQKRGQRAANSALSYSGNQQRYLDRGGQGAILEGTNRRADLISQLQDYLNQNAGKIADLRGQKALQLSQNSQSFVNSMADAQAKQDQNMADALWNVINLKSDIQKNRAQNNLDQQKILASQQNSGGLMSAAPKNMQDIAKILSTGSHPRQLKKLIDNLSRTQNFTEGRFTARNKTDILKMTPYEAANEAEAAARKQGINSPKDIARIRLAAMQLVQ